MDVSGDSVRIVRLLKEDQEPLVCAAFLIKVIKSKSKCTNQVQVV